MKGVHGKEVKPALAKVATLKGIGPATASALLSAAFPETVAFMSDAAYEAALSVKPKAYSAGEYLKYAEAMLAASTAMTGTMHLAAMEQALWAERYVADNKLVPGDLGEEEKGEEGAEAESKKRSADDTSEERPAKKRRM